MEYFTQWLENCSIISSARRDCVQPDVIIPSIENTLNTFTRKVVIPEKFKKDIQKLCEFIGKDVGNICFSNVCIDLSLQEALTLMPRKRKRTDAYNSLKQYMLNYMGITLIIKSQKSK